MKLIQQTSYQDCGVACLAMLISHFYQTELDIQQIKYQLDLTDEQLSFYDLIEIGQTFSFVGEAFQIDLDFEQLNNKTPFIAQVINSEGLLHFVVIEYFNQKRIRVLDPSKQAKITMSLANFMNIFQGYVVIFKANKTQFKQEFSLKLSNLKALVSIYSGFYLWSSLVISLLIILETRIINIYAETFAYPSQSYQFYLIFIVVFLLSLLFKKLSWFFLQKAHQHNQQQVLKKFLSYTASKHHQDFYNFYSQIIWVGQYEYFRMLTYCSALLTETLSLIVIFFISKQLFLIFLLNNVLTFLLIRLMLLIPKQTNNQLEKQWYHYLTNLDYLKNNGQEVGYAPGLLTPQSLTNHHQNQELILDLADKLIGLLTFFISWGLIKHDQLSFSAFFMVLLLKGFNKSSLISLHGLLGNWKQYRMYRLKFDKLLTKQVKLKKLEAVNEIEIYNYQTTQTTSLHANQINQIDANINKQIFNKLKTQANWAIFYNKINISLLDNSSVRSHVVYLKTTQIQFGTIYQNIIGGSPTKSNEIFKTKQVEQLLNNYKIKIEKLIEPNNVEPIEVEIIHLLKVFYYSQKVVVLDNNFKIIEKAEITTILQLFIAINSDKFLILS